MAGFVEICANAGRMVPKQTGPCRAFNRSLPLSGLPSQSAGLPSHSAGLTSESVGLPSESAGLPSQSAGLPSQSAGLPSKSAGLPPQSPVLLSCQILRCRPPNILTEVGVVLKWACSMRKIATKLQ